MLVGGAPRLVRPLPLNRLLVSDHLVVVVFQGQSAEFLVNFEEPLENLLLVHIFKGLIFDVAIDVGRRHIWVVVASHGHF